MIEGLQGILFGAGLIIFFFIGMPMFVDAVNERRPERTSPGDRGNYSQIFGRKPPSDIVLWKRDN